MFKKVGLLMDKPSGQNKSRETLFAIHVRQITRSVIQEEFSDLDEDTLKSIKVKSFKNGLLTVSAPGVMAAELYMRASRLVDNINEKLGAKILKNLRVRTT